MFLVFEGIDKSGKSTLSSDFLQYINTQFRGEDGMIKIDPHLGDFIWTKEPTFTSEEADQLNSPGFVDEYKRERIFFESRFRHQDILGGRNVICDRYIWSGLAYARAYSPTCLPLLKELYLSEKLFLQPDLYIFLDTPPEVCYDRDPSLDLSRLKILQEAFHRTQQYIEAPIITMQSLGGEERALQELIMNFEEYIEDYEPCAEDASW